MKNVINAVIVATSLVVSSSALAQTKPANTCAMVESLAKQVMSNRQAGVSLSEMIKVTQNPKAGALGAVMRELTIKAYEKPQYGTAEYKIKATNEFANQAALLCLKASK
jgi:hypothetical protein